MPWWLRRFVDFLGWMGARITARRYAVVSRKIGRTADEVELPAERRRFLALQIDGLSYETLLRAMAIGYTPTLQRLIATGHRLQSWRCGLPSSTPAVQAGIMYGNNWDIPAFRWYDKQSGDLVMCKFPPQVARIKQRVKGERIGILSGGSSYTNMMDGDARLALFTLSAMGRQHFFEHLRGIGWAMLFVLNPLTTLRTVSFATWHLLQAWSKAIVVWARGGMKRRLTLLKPFLQVVSNSILGEIQTFGVLLDVYRGMPAIYANFYGYDEVAHSAGPLGREALSALRRIDGQIRKIERVRHYYWPDMDLYVLSDHGMSESVPFREKSGQSLEEFVADHVQATVARQEVDALNADAGDPAGFLLDELAGIEAHLSPRGQRMTQALRHFIGGDDLVSPDESWDLQRSSDVIVRCSGNLAHLYFNVTREKMEVSEIAILYPELLRALSRHPDIGLVLGMEDGHAVQISSDGAEGLSHAHWPAGLSHPEQTASELHRLLSFPSSGDLVLLGAWDPQGRVVTFATQAATHGGAGGAQEEPFFLSPPGSAPNLSVIGNARELYPYFMDRYHGVTGASVGH